MGQYETGRNWTRSSSWRSYDLSSKLSFLTLFVSSLNRIEAAFRRSKRRGGGKKKKQQLMKAAEYYNGCNLGGSRRDLGFLISNPLAIKFVFQPEDDDKPISIISPLYPSRANP